MTIADALLGLLEGTNRHGYDLKQSTDRIGATSRSASARSTAPWPS